MKKTYAAPARRSLTAAALADRRFAKRVVKPRKGKGAYNRGIARMERMLGELLCR